MLRIRLLHDFIYGLQRSIVEHRSKQHISLPKGDSRDFQPSSLEFPDRSRRGSEPDLCGHVEVRLDICS